MSERTLDPIDRLFDILGRAGAAQYGNERVTQLDHALQCAQQAEAAGAPPALIGAALLHDIGHLVHKFGEDAAVRGIDDRHERLGSKLLAKWFVPELSEPVALHVDAKRYLCATEPSYNAMLSPGSVRSLALQGGAYDTAGAAAFRARPYAEDAVRVRRWDEAAKVLGRPTPDLEHFRLCLAASRKA
jgi:[1-hydroxy-2-(trimethylamino)ethyl]phosphonate dioxygenase